MSADYDNTGRITSVISLLFCKWAYLDSTTVTEKQSASRFGDTLAFVVFFLTSAWLFFFLASHYCFFSASLPDVSLSSHSAWYIWDALDPWVRRKESSWNRSKPRRSADPVGEYWMWDPSRGLRIATVPTEERQQGRNNRCYWMPLLYSM